MKRVFNHADPCIDMKINVDKHNPVTAFYLTNLCYEKNRELPFPVTKDPNTWESWRKELRERLANILTLDKLGEPPNPVYEIIEEEKVYNYTRRKIAYETLKGNWAIAYLLIPDEITKPVPAVLSVHGHFRGGSKSVVFPDQAPGKAIAHEFAIRGIAAFAPENAGMASPTEVGTCERDVPASYAQGQRMGGCNLLFRRLNHLGLDISGFRIFELQAALNILSNMAEIDSGRIGCAGISGGCWLSQLLAALDTRIKSVILCSYFTTFAQTAWIGHCVCHHPFGIGNVCDMPDISALITPRPQFVESGSQDVDYPVEPAFSMVRQAYDLLDAGDSLGIDIFEGGHRFNAVKSVPWMIEQLK